MAQIETWYSQDLKKPVPVNNFGVIYNEDSEANKIGVRLFSDGVALQSISGSVTGYFLLADGTTTSIAGSKSGNEATVIVPPSAYKIPGPITITVRITDGNSITTVCACVGLIMRAKTPVATPAGSTVADWSAQISAELQACQDAADNLGSIVASAYSTIQTYAVGTYVTNSGNLYRCTTPVATAGSWASNSSNFTQVKVGDDLRDVRNIVDGVLDIVYSPNLYNTDTITNGIYINPANGSEQSNSNYQTTDYIPVEAGEKYYGTWTYGGGTTQHDMALNFITCYDSSKQVMGSAGMTSASNPITIPSGVAYIRISQSNMAYYTDRQFEKGETYSTYYPYGIISKTIDPDCIPVDDTLTTEGIPADAKTVGDRINAIEGNIVPADGINQVTPQNLQILDKVFSPNLIDLEKVLSGSYITKNGTIQSNQNYIVTDYIPVTSGENYCCTWEYNNLRGNANIRFLACYDSSKNVVESAGSDDSISSYPITFPSGVNYVRLSLNVANTYSKPQFEQSSEPTAYYPYGSLVSAVVDDDYLPFDEDDIQELETGLNAKIDISGINQVTPANLQIIEDEYAPNLYNTETVTNNIYLNPANGSEQSNSNYQTTDYIPVEAGEKYYGTWAYATGTERHDMNLSFITCYDSSKQVMGSAGMTSASNPITIPNGVSFIRISHSNMDYYTKRQFEKGETYSTYYPYGTVLDSKIKKQYMPDTDMSTIPAFHLVDGQNLLNPNDPEYKKYYFLDTSGSVSSNSGYTTSGYIEVSEGDNLMGSYVINNGTGLITLRTVAAYNERKVCVSAKGVYSVANYTVPSGIKYVRIAFNSGTYGYNVQICKTDSNTVKPYKAYEEPHYKLKKEYMFPVPDEPKHVYLPHEIYIAVGRTIEFYNEQVVLDHEKYHFKWACSEGNAYKRKFSITPTQARDIKLYLTLYDDNMSECWVGLCNIHAVSASNPTKKILPIGDSLTNWKKWLPETMLLSSQHITFVGTRYSGLDHDSEGNTYASGTIHHEGRSGWSAGDYLDDTTYTFDNHYDGVPGVSGSANPFWDGSKFSLEHYLTTQTGIDTPDAVQIFLGTNDLTKGVETAISNIKSMVNSIRSEYENIPIFVCNTIYRSNQNGYGGVGNDAYAGGGGAGSWQYDQDSKVMDLAIGLRKELESTSGVYLIPLHTCMDREYDFGQVMTKVNPRSTVEIPMPAESVHPTEVGYYQIADLLYSTYCGVLGAST